MCEKNQVQIIGRSATKERLISEAQAGLVQREREYSTLRHLHTRTLLLLQLCYVDQVVLRRLAVRLTKVQFYRVLARKSSVAELALECGAQVFLGGPQWAQSLVGEGFGDALLLLNLTEW